MKQVSCLNVWLDHPKFGCGKRDVIALVGRKWVTLILAATAEHARISANEFRAMGGRPIACTKLAKRLRRNARTYGREDSGPVKEVLRGLSLSNGARNKSAPLPQTPADHRRLL